MRILRDYHAPKECKGAVLALGNFDGVHLGHQAIFKHTVALAKAENCPAAVMTFEPHPREFFARDHAPMRLYPFRCKAGLIAEANIDVLFALRFGKRLAGTSAESFIEDILHKELAVRHVVTGYNFAFGKGRAGNTELLSHMAEKLGFGFTAHQPVHDSEEAVISSSHIRKLVAEGGMREAARQLGKPYSIIGHVQRGKQRGAALGFPTINIALTRLFKPRFGIYAVRVKIGKEHQWLDGVASVGVNPTFSPVEPLLEVHLFDINRNLYGALAQVEFIDFLRDEKKFENTDALGNQMLLDSLQAKAMLAEKGIG